MRPIAIAMQQSRPPPSQPPQPPPPSATSARPEHSPRSPHHDLESPSTQLCVEERCCDDEPLTPQLFEARLKRATRTIASPPLSPTSPTSPHTPSTAIEPNDEHVQVTSDTHTTPSPQPQQPQPSINDLSAHQLRLELALVKHRKKVIWEALLRQRGRVERALDEARGMERGTGIEQGAEKGLEKGLEKENGMGMGMEKETEKGTGKGMEKGNEGGNGIGVKEVKEEAYKAEQLKMVWYLQRDREAVLRGLLEGKGGGEREVDGERKVGD